MEPEAVPREMLSGMVPNDEISEIPEQMLPMVVVWS